MTFVFDLDDTICTTDADSERYILEFFRKRNWPYKQIAKVVRFAESKFNWGDEMARLWYKEYGDQMMLEFGAREGAVEIINKLYDSGHRIVIATARATDWHREPAKITQEWLERVGLKHHKLYIGRIDKEKICEEENADFFVDDDVKIVARVAEYFSKDPKKCAYLMTTDYNQNLSLPKGAARVAGFNELVRELGSSVSLNGEEWD